MLYKPLFWKKDMYCLPYFFVLKNMNKILVPNREIVYIQQLYIYKKLIVYS